MAVYSLTKNPPATAVFFVSKDHTATKIQVTKNPGAAGGTCILTKNLAAADGKVVITKNG